MTKTSDSIEYLIRAEFPGTNAPPPPGSITSALSSLDPRTGSEAAKQWKQQQRAQFDRRAELSRMPADELRALVERRQAQEREQDRIRREQQTPAATEPEAAYWTRAEEWLLLDAALLLVKLEPRAALGLHLKQMLNGDVAHQPFVSESNTVRGLSDDARQRWSRAHEIRENAQAAARNNRLVIAHNRTVQPCDFLVWARDRDYALPAAFESLMAGVRSKAELEQELKRLRAELDQVWKFDEAGSHYPPELDIALQAWRAVSNKPPASAGTVRQRLEAWIKNTRPDLNPEQIKRIAIIANWDKQSGRKSVRTK